MSDNQGLPEPDPIAEIDRLKAENEKLKNGLRRRAAWRRVLTMLLVVLTSLSVVATTFGIWAHRTLLDTDAFMATVGPALEDPALYDAVANRVSSEALDALDLETRVTDGLTSLDQYLSQALADALDLGEPARDLLSRFNRPSLAALAPSIVEALESRIDSRIHQFVESDRFRTRVPQLVERSHEVAVALLRNETASTPNVYVAESEVRLNLIPIISEALNQVVSDLAGFLPDVNLPDVVSNAVDEGRQQLQEAIGARLPDDFGQVTLMSEDVLTTAQQSVERLDRLVWLLLGISLILVVVTIVTSTSRRRTAIHVGLGIVVGIVIAAVVVRQVESAVVERITSPDVNVAAGALLSQILSSLRRVEILVALAAVVVAIGSYLAGRPAWVTTVAAKFEPATTPGENGSEFDNWVGSHFDIIRLAGVALGILVLFLVGLGWVSVLVIGLLLALFLWVVTEARDRAAGLDPDPAEAELVAGGSIDGD